MKRTFSNRSLSRSDTLPLPKRSRSTKRKAIRPRPERANVSGANSRLAPTLTNTPIREVFQLIASPSPFPEKLTRVVTWRGTPTELVGATASSYARLVVNGPYDPDYDNLFGNQQPLYWDQLTSATGPYRAYYVKRWTCVWQIMNRDVREFEVYLDQAEYTTDDDTVAEMRVRPTPMRAILGGSVTSQARVDMVCSGTSKQFFDAPKSSAQLTAFNANPTLTVYQTLLWNNITGTATYDMIITPTLTMEIEFSSADATSS